jgi:hypothetical protein
MTEYEHAHPLPGGRRFEHTHNIRPALREAHAAAPLELAHPDMAAVARAPVPGSPAELREHAEQLRGEAEELDARARALRTRAAELDERADADEQQPPSEAERVRGLLEGGLS